MLKLDLLRVAVVRLGEARGGCCLLLGGDGGLLWFEVRSAQRPLEALRSKFSCACPDPEKQLTLPAQGPLAREPV